MTINLFYTKVGVVTRVVMSIERAFSQLDFRLISWQKMSSGVARGHFRLISHMSSPLDWATEVSGQNTSRVSPPAQVAAAETGGRIQGYNKKR